MCGGIWCIVQLEYEYLEEDRRANPIRVRKLTPTQMPHIELDEIKQARREFTKEEWLNVLIRSTGMESDKFSNREKWLLLARMIPLVENNFNLCELGPRSTGKPICSSGAIVINYATILATPNLKFASADGAVGFFLTPNKKYFSLD